MRPSSQQDERGVTLIEVMIVVAIMSILAGLAAPNMIKAYHRANLKGEGRKLYSGFLEAKSLATTESVPHCLFLDRANGVWAIRRNANDDDACDTDDSTVRDSDTWPDYIAFGPAGGLSTDFVSPYHIVDRDSWCTVCDTDDGSIFFDIDGRIIDKANRDDPHNGAVMLYDPTGSSSGLATVVFFIGATGNIRLVERAE